MRSTNQNGSSDFCTKRPQGGGGSCGRYPLCTQWVAIMLFHFFIWIATEGR